jgi:hypothetical protein
VIHHLLRTNRQVFHRETKSFIHFPSRSRAAEGSHAIRSMRILGPSLCPSCLHRHHWDPSGENFQLIFQTLSLKELPARHGHYTDRGTSCGHRFGDFNGELDFSAGGGNDEFAVTSTSFRDGVSSIGLLFGGSVRLGRGCLATEREHRGRVGVLNRTDIGSSHFVAITRTKGQQIWCRT